jgi:hypothetical protein
MKKFYTFSLAILIAGGAFAQNAISFKNVLKTKAVSPVSQIQSKAVIWSDDFTTPANWVIDHQSGTTGDWVIGTNGPSGTYAIAAIASTSGGNFALFDSDNLCSGNQVPNLTTANPINLTGHTGVMLQFEQMYRRWYDSTFVFVSTDGTNWTKFPVNATYANNQTSSNPNVVSVNISSAIIANPANVKIRFQFYSPSSMGTSAGCGYAWMIDDVKIIDALTNDVEVVKTLANFAGTSYYEVIPLSQATTYDVSGIVANNGTAAQTNVTLHAEDATNGINGTASFATLASGAQDTLTYTVTLNNTTPKNFGIKMSATQTETDEVPQNNIGDSIYFSTNPSLYLRTSSLTSLLTSYSFGTSAPAITGMEYGANYAFLNNDKVDSIFVLIYGAHGTGTITGKLYNVDLTTGARTVVAQTNPYTPTGTPEFKQLALTTPYSITTPSVLTATVQLNLTIASHDTIYIGADGSFLGDASAAGAAYLNANNAWGWYYVNNTCPIVGVTNDHYTGVNPLNLSNNVMVYPNPVSNTLYIMNEKAVNVEIYNLNGQCVAKYNNQNVINVAKLAQGTYMVKVVTNNNVITQKINIVR